ncbi:FAD-dependent oxidoreductase [Roseomonas marmotae]|uniref:FAD-dependent oxidoreductase n=1 Tax=Roseomonas marmotae TaxID=2768161 RepID=A0ABS3KAY5_9PROT|nr:FAD-dependent oxidoreductase [Roseomonas marmotae]MBO1074607.1 FAD-dependent oxidoreductase [Roseomonas marmotae]QTI81631.1 FAD-dependent oxidoreductase [Roseomonas marmotae]
MNIGPEATVDYQSLVLNYARSADQDAAAPAHHPVVVVGAGPVGLTAAVDLAQQGVPVLLLDDDDRLSTGSRAICFAKRTLEIWDRLGCGQRMVDKGVTWNQGKVIFREDPVYSFNLLPEAGHHRPAFINLQQYYVEGFLLEHALTLPNLEIRWKNRVEALEAEADGVTLHIATPEGSYDLRCDWLVAADGSRSPIRKAMGLESKGQTFRDRFLIADVRMEADFPSERWFWFDPPFHPNQSVLLHRQPDGVWRIDFQLGWDADPVAERQPERVIPRVQALLGKDTRFELEWVSVYSFSCLRMERFRHGRVLFAGDSAHGVSPFGARGANGGVQDAENLAWKLRLVVEGRAPESLLDSYDIERAFAADENIRHSTRSTDFITPKNEASRAFRDATLELARDCGFARRLVNSGRLSVPSIYRDSALNTPDGGNDSFAGALVPGAPAADAPVRDGDGEGWFLSKLGTGQFIGLYFSDGSEMNPVRLETLRGLTAGSLPVRLVLVEPQGLRPGRTDGLPVLEDAEGLLAQRYDARPGTFYLLRPDHHVCARWRHFDQDQLRQALARATGHA